MVPMAPDGPAVEQQLQAILSSPTFAQADRLRELLAYLVREALGGKTAELKEVVIALEVFGRQNYDPKTESLIRVTMSKLRTKLGEYYAGPGAGDPIRIAIPKGSFAPEFMGQPSGAGKSPAWRW